MPYCSSVREALVINVTNSKIYYFCTIFISSCVNRYGNYFIKLIRNAFSRLKVHTCSLAINTKAMQQRILSCSIILHYNQPLKLITPTSGGTRTRNPRLRRPVPYPFGHRGSKITKCPRLLWKKIYHSSLRASLQARFWDGRCGGNDSIRIDWLLVRAMHARFKVN